ncbi:MAG: hypothetical protein IJ150_05550 [Bacteroidales bacterium]|nr:hypothetical protein [Bacteroidales bacterium]
MEKYKCPYCGCTHISKTVGSYVKKGFAIAGSVAVTYGLTILVSSVFKNVNLQRPEWEKEVQWCYKCDKCGKTF